MEQQENKVKLIEILKEVEEWRIEDKAKFFEKIGESVPIGIRIIVGREEISDTQKIEALRLINEFHHEMNKIKKSISSIVGFKFQIKRIYDYIKFMANKNEKLIAAEISFCVKDAFRMMNFLKIRKNKNSKLEPSIYRLFEDEQFDNKIAEYLGKESLENLEGFILGYFYAIDSNEIRMHGTRVYPNLQKIKEWISNEKYVEDWKKELKSNESSVKEFLNRFRNKIRELD